MHLSIPDTREFQDENGSSYTVSVFSSSFQHTLKREETSPLISFVSEINTLYLNF